MKIGGMLEATVPTRSRAIVFAIEANYYIIVTDFGNISKLTEQETLSIYRLTNEWSSPDVWLQEKVDLLKQLMELYPDLKDLIEL